MGHLGVFGAIFFFCGGTMALAQPLVYPTPHPRLEELKRLKRCYALFTGERIDPSHPLYLAVSSPEPLAGASAPLSGTDACMQVLSSADLGTNDQLAPEQVSIGSKILTQFTVFFRAQQTNKDPSVGMLKNKDLYDANETAYHWVYALFKPNEEVRKVVTRSSALRAIRQTERLVRTQSLDGLSVPVVFKQGNDPSSAAPTTKQLWNPTLVPTGRLIGIKLDSLSNKVNYVSRFNLDSFGTTLTPNLETNLHYGGGFLGSQTYQHATNRVLTAPNGLITPRSWAKAVFQDALCRTLPVIRSADAMPKVRTASSLPWANGATCQTCHVAMDGMAGLNRNRIPVQTADGDSATFWHDLPKTQPAAPLPLDGPDADFSKRPPTGVLFFRNYRGELVNLSLEGLDALGNGIASQDDFYACAAKRLFEKLTGIEITLGDLSDPANPVSLTPNELFFRNLVIEHGLKLKQTQNLKTLIRDVITSDFFLHPDRGRPQ